MIDLVKRFFGKTDTSHPHGQPGERPRDVRVATCALFLEMANIDGEFTDQERERILSILKKDFDLPEVEAAAMMAAAREQLDQSIDLWRFTRLIRDNYSREEKAHIVEMLWRIIYVDGTLDKYEDYLVHKVSELLHLSHEELIDAKMRVLHGGRSGA